MSTPAFTPDDRYDRTHASDGHSRLGSYLRGRFARFLDASGEPTRDPLAFAAAAWDLAQTPVMDPPYLRRDRRVLAAASTWDEHDRLAVAVELAVPPRHELERALPGACRSRDREPRMSPPTARIPISALGLPEARYVAPGALAAGPWVEAAKDAVHTLASRLNTALADVLDQLESREAV